MALQQDGRKQIWKDRLSPWDFSVGTSLYRSILGIAPEIRPRNVFNGPPRVLEVGCSDGDWCFKVKMEEPEWIVEGIDDTDHWSCVPRDFVLG